MSCLEICPFGVYMDNHVKKPHTNALFTEPRHIHCERDKCALWGGDACSVKKAMLALSEGGVEQ